MRRVRVLCQRCGEPDRRLAVGGDADGLVAVAFAGLAVGGQEPARGLPGLPPLGLGEPGGLKVVPSAGEPFAASHHAHPPRPLIGPQVLQPILQEVQTAGLGEPLLRRAVTAWLLAGAFLSDGQRQPMGDRADGDLEVADVVGLAAASQRPLIVGGFGDGPGPA
ncbi:hypothetical protein ACIBI9_12025 [Nonomuraea sp. NPDC050451]|uniref:hypothetical protein n=1 Tax=Nonomuraea sp. NPDC050451 TaxID=3364364 RepID=UPI003789E99C